MIRLIAFLGNQGREYRGNRHNVAWQFLESMPEYAGLSWQRKFKGRYAFSDAPAGRSSPGERLYAIVPETFMNASGESVADIMKFYRIGAAELLVVHDELEMPFGSAGWKFGGGLGGHNGLRSLKACLGTPDFYRLRFGIGRPAHDDVAGYVLSDFLPEERELLRDRIFPAAAASLGRCMEEGPDPLVASFPKKRLIE